MDADVTLSNWFAARAALTPKRRALTFEGTTWTYEAFQHEIDCVANTLQLGGVRHGDRVGFLGLNQPAFFKAMFAASRIGAIFVPLNFRLTGPELAYIVGDAGIHTLVADAQHQAVIDSIRDDLPVHRYLSEAANDHWGPLDDGAGPLPLPEPLRADEVALIMYTSGTTGLPKGAMLTHANLWWNNTNALHQMDIVESDVTLVVAPLFHIGGLNVTTLVTWQKGGEIVLHRSFDPAACLEDIGRYGVTTMFGVPAMFLFMSQLPTFNDADLTTVRMLICGGAPVPEPLIKLYNGRGISFNQGYGLTETAPLVTFLGPEHALEKVGSAGRAPLFTEVRLVDEQGHVLTTPHLNGEVCARGPNVMKGYWRRPDATALAIDQAGWFRTGDVGFFDDEGFLYIADRVKDMVITGGENVYPAEVESVLHEHPLIDDVAVIGLPDARWGEAVVAIVVPAKDAVLTLEDVRAFAGERLARYKLPTHLETIDELPRNPAGKILKFQLRERFGSAAS
jgi:fatty-acyl-CoA synthase